MKMKIKIIALVIIIFVLSLSALVDVEADHKGYGQGSRGQGVRGQGVNKVETQQQKIALVIGNSAYQIAPLKNPVNDAQDMAKALRDLDFSVDLKLDLPKDLMYKAVKEFGSKIEANSVVLFYYAGHGIQSNGENYLVPVDADIKKEGELPYETIPAGLLLAQMEEGKNTLNLVILDACRNNPFARSFRSANSGLAQMKAPTGTLIAYATQPGSVASDGSGRNGLYTQEFLKVMKTPGLKIEEVFKQVRRSVISLSNNQQTPWDSSSLVGDFSFVSGTVGPTGENPSTSTTLALDARAAEENYWNSVDKTDVGELRSYLKKYPQGEYADLANTKIKKLETASNPEGAVSNTNSNNPSSNSNNSSSGPTAVAAGTVMGADPAMDRRMTGEFVYIPVGNFTMGSSNGESDEKPEHEVVISRSYEMGKYEVTQEQWEGVMGNNPSYFKGEGRLPVEQVSWEDVQQFINALNGRSRKYTYRLPTEAEWEYAARAGSRGEYGGNLEAMGWYKDNSGGKTHAVGGKQANAWGLYDMHGNVWEWCSDWKGSYSSGTATDPRGASSGSIRVVRGGGYGSGANNCRSANRDDSTPDGRFILLGFRLLRTVR